MSKAFIVDPATYDKREAFDAAVSYIDRFLNANGMSMPSKIMTEPPNNRLEWHDFGRYKFHGHKMYVNVQKSRHPGYQWSYTGHIIDNTAPGVLAHEIGHHIHNVIGKKVGCRKLMTEVRMFVKGEAKVSNYEPDTYELIAEMFRLFIMNPTLLAEGRPKRYSFITNVLEIEPPHEEDWRTVLHNAHPRIIKSAERWLLK